MTEKLIGTGLTFDDVLLVPAESEVLPKDARADSRLTRIIQINTPIVSATKVIAARADTIMLSSLLASV